MQHVSVLKDHHLALKRLMMVFYLCIEDIIKCLLCLIVM